jgi:uncharacterized protein YaaR (DUF327 family)
MERIDFPDGFFQVPQKSSGKKETKRIRRPHFFSFIQSEIEEQEESKQTTFLSMTPGEIQDSLEKYLDTVHEIGERLKNDPTLRSVQEYKKAVRDFLKLVVGLCYKVEEKTSSKGVLDRKKYTQIQVIDEKLERLAAEVMRTQRDQLDILKRVDEIYGALVDLLQ